ncbi:FAD dependent oxidoreductase [Dactylonectria estremocensis]|uniref:FAD dependent oxidoreductase n=1 Tax=Dactylonectria estremocensis TaxID=1079267 RepID=A0A9P9EG17_9HYPO|nr:FAD dependent oxidoreductase [Dactylonectria estremocensis]
MTTRNPIAKSDSILIVGAGAFGLSTALELNKRGFKNITVLDRYQPPVVDSSSVDISRVIRVEYADELYAKMAREALAAWTTDFKTHYYSSGFVMLADKSGNAYLENTKTINKSLGGELIEYSEASQVLTKYPSIPSNLEGLTASVNEKGGWADAEKSINQLSQECSLAGVSFITGPRGRVLSLRHSGKRVIGVNVAQGDPILASQVIIATGAWSNRLLPMAHATSASGQPVGFIKLTPEEAEPLRKMPVIINLSTGIFCFPPTPDTNVLKVARHGYGFATQVPVEDSPRFVSSPKRDGNNAGASYLPDDADKALRDGLRQLLPAFANSPWMDRRLCWYSDTPEGDFIIDYHPQAEGLFVATGGAGHAFKFLPVLGRYIADCFENKASSDIRRKWRLRLPTGKDEMSKIGDGSRQGPPLRTLAGHEQAKL